MKKLLIILSLAICLTGCYGGGKSYNETQFLMDTVCTIEAGGENSKEAVIKCFDYLKELQDKVNLYDENSLVSKFNRAKAYEEISLDHHTGEIIETCLRVSEMSGGAFDITIAPVTELWSFKEGAVPPDDEEIKKKLGLVGYEKLVYNKEKNTIKKTVDNVRIDLGGAAKGYGADMAARLLKEEGVDYGMINLGGNVLCFGDNPKRWDGVWKVGLQKPFGDNGEIYKTIDIEDYGAVVTSGTYQRYFYYNHKLYHHILDPKTGYSTDNGINSVTIVGQNGLLADCLATACQVLGEAEGTALARRNGVQIYLD